MKKSLALIKGQKVVTDSLIIAEKFKKRHDRVIRKIENTIKEDEDNHLNFGVVKYRDKKGEWRKKYLMDRRSFSILCMGFTGKKAFKWKNKFYDAFEQMERLILQQKNHSWQQARIEGKQDRHEFTEVIKKLVELAKNSGSNNADRYYESISTLVYQQLFNINKVPLNFRDSLCQDSLKQLKIVEFQAAKWLDNTIETCTDYHEPYYILKEKLKTLILVIGVQTINYELSV